jgi:hypothetical protein
MLVKLLLQSLKFEVPSNCYLRIVDQILQRLAEENECLEGDVEENGRYQSDYIDAPAAPGGEGAHEADHGRARAHPESPRTNPCPDTVFLMSSMTTTSDATNAVVLE